MDGTHTIDAMTGWVNIQPTTAGAIIDCGGDERAHLNRLSLLELKHVIESIVETQLAAKVAPK